MKPYPLHMRPHYQPYLWGGGLLRAVFGKESGYEVTAESWELSAHPDGQSVIANGLYAGQPFGDWVRAHPKAIGRNGAGMSDFPVLVKFLDVHTRLSVQVHPGEDTADAAAGEQGKAEVWYIVDARPGAFLYFGLTHELTREDFEQRVRENTVCEALNRVDVKPGQIWFITPGVLHCAGGGVLIAEVQQSANTTFRVYDFDRRGADGKPRPLHIKRACDVMRYQPVSLAADRLNSSFQTPAYIFDRIFACDHFKLARVRVSSEIPLFCDGNSFHALLFLRGGGTLLCGETRLPFRAGDSFFLPAGMGAYSVLGGSEFLLTTI